MQQLKSNSRNSQQNANNALGNLNPNFPKPPLPPGGHSLTGSRIPPGRKVATPIYNNTRGPINISGKKVSTKKSQFVKNSQQKATASAKGVVAQNTRHIPIDVPWTQLTPSDATGYIGSGRAISEFNASSSSQSSFVPPSGEYIWPVGFDPAYNEVIKQIRDKTLTILQILDDVLSFLDQEGPDPVSPYPTRGPQLDALVKHTEEKLDALLSFFHTILQEPSSPDNQRKWNELHAELVKLENWYYATKGTYYGDYP